MSNIRNRVFGAASQAFGLWRGLDVLNFILGHVKYSFVSELNAG